VVAFLGILGSACLLFLGEHHFLKLSSDCCKVNILWLKSIVYEIDYCIVIKRNKQK
jgi:hypothetical protein